MRLANSLRLRAAMRLRFIDPDLARQEGEAAIADGLMQSNDDNAYIECRADASSGWGHPLYMMATWQGLAMSDKMEDVLKHTSTVEDPRMELWFWRVARLCCRHRSRLLPTALPARSFLVCPMA